MDGSPGLARALRIGCAGARVDRPVRARVSRESSSLTLLARTHARTAAVDDGAALLAERGVAHVVLLEANTLGEGASSRAAGMVRAQGGTEPAIRLGMRSQEFYRSSGDRFPLDCGFVAQGYLMPCFSEPEVTQALARIELQRSLGLDVEWLTGSDVDARSTGIAAGPSATRATRVGEGPVVARASSFKPRNFERVRAAASDDCAPSASAAARRTSGARSSRASSRAGTASGART